MWQKTIKRDDAFLIRNRTINPRKTSSDLQQELSEAGIKTQDSVCKKHIKSGKKVVRPQMKLLLTIVMIKKIQLR